MDAATAATLYEACQLLAMADRMEERVNADGLMIPGSNGQMVPPRAAHRNTPRPRPGHGRGLRRRPGPERRKPSRGRPGHETAPRPHPRRQDRPVIGRRTRRATAQETAPVIVPRDRTGDLPAWSPLPPPGGWTPASAFDTALDYADEHAHLGQRRSLAKAAYWAILAAVPGLKRAEVHERLRGVDCFRLEFNDANG
jgi:hypothetical protein